MVGPRGGGDIFAETPPLKVLVIDDEYSHPSLVSRVAWKNGYDVAVVHSAEDGLAKFEERGFNRVTSDILMKGIGDMPSIGIWLWMGSGGDA